MRRLAALVLLLAVSLLALPRPIRAAPSVQARDWAIVDAADGALLDARNPHDRTAMASLTKVMTALVAVERADLELRVTVVTSDLVGGSSANLRPGETVSLRTLLYGLLLPSGNDAAMAIARAVGGSPQVDDPAARARFIGWMNDRAAELGLADTRYVNPHGLDQNGHYSSAADLALVTRAALENPRFLQIFGSHSYDAEGHQYTSVNRMLTTYPGIVGGKTGITNNAGYALIEVARRQDRELIVVLIGSTPAAWYTDAVSLLDDGWTFPGPADPTLARDAAAFLGVANQDDLPVALGLTQRALIWGATLGDPRTETYEQAPGGERIVQYFDKGRLELTGSGTAAGGADAITAGRLAWELITGLQQIGDNRFAFRGSAELQPAGDGGQGPTYADLTNLLGVPPPPSGAALTLRLAAGGRLVADPQLAGAGVTAGPIEPHSGHSVASVFQQFLAAEGPVYADGHIGEGPLFADPLALTGYPITEAYWVQVPVDGTTRDVLLQCFERRCLTYTPANPAGWQVEMANTGHQYLQWLEQPPLMAQPGESATMVSR